MTRVGTYAAAPSRAAAPLSYTRARVAELSPMQLAAWRKLQATDARYDSAFYTPELVAALDAEREGVEVAIAERDGVPVAFLPFRRTLGSFAAPSAGAFGDFDGPITAPGESVDPRALLRSCELSCWVFEHAPAGDEALASFSVTTAEAPFIDTSGGFEAYARRRNELGGRELKGALRKERKIRSEVGSLLLVPNEQDPRVLELLLGWKNEQIRVRGMPDPLAQPWIPRFLRRIAALREEACAGMLTALYAGEQIAALSFGVRSRRTLHGWITAYDPRFARYSPGALLLVSLVRAAEGLGIARIDMGPGREPYKWRFHTGVRPLAGGAVHARRLLQPALSGVLRAREWGRWLRKALAARKRAPRSERE